MGDSSRDEKTCMPERWRSSQDSQDAHATAATHGNAASTSPSSPGSAYWPAYSAPSIRTAERYHSGPVHHASGYPQETRGDSIDDLNRRSSLPMGRKPVQRRVASDTASRTASAHRTGPKPESPSLTVRTRSTSTTGNLFNQASRSLGSLTETLVPHDAPRVEDHPPPYIVEDASAPTSNWSDIKQYHRFSRDPYELIDLIQIVRENRIEALRRLLERGTDIDEIDPQTRRTAIMEAAYLRRSRCAQLLVEVGCRLHLKDVEGNTALHFAAAHGDTDTCRLLLEAEAQLDEYNIAGETPTQLAARGGHTEALLCLLNSWTLQRANGSSLLNGFMEATKSGNVSTAEAFVEWGIKPKNVEDAWKLVANAAESGSIPMVDFLLMHKVDLKQRSPDGWTALHFASAAGHTAMVEKLLIWKLPWKAQTKKTKETALHLAILGQHTATAFALIFHKDSRITIEDADGQQPIHHAARNGDATLVTTLLNRGLLLNKGSKQEECNAYGWTPMLLACAYGYLHLVAEFITRGVSVEEKLDAPAFRPSKKTNQAAQKRYWAEIRWPHVGARPLHLALEFGHDDVANTLIAAGARIEEGDAAGWKPLHYAAFSGRLDMVEMLLARGASPHSTTDDGNTPLSLGFREVGLTASYEQREGIYNLLQNAMHARKKSKFKQLTSFMNAGTNKGNEVRNRNRIWHTAGLADALYQSGQLVAEDEDDDTLVLTPTTSIQPSLDDHFDEDTLASPVSRRASRFTTKTMMDD